MSKNVQKIFERNLGDSKKSRISSQCPNNGIDDENYDEFYNSIGSDQKMENIFKNTNWADFAQKVNKK